MKRISALRVLLVSCALAGASFFISACDGEPSSWQDDSMRNEASSLDLDPEPQIDWNTFAVARKISGCCAIRVRFIQSSPPTFDETEFLKNGRVDIYKDCTLVSSVCLNGNTLQLSATDVCNLFTLPTGQVEVCGNWCIVYRKTCDPASTILHRQHFYSYLCDESLECPIGPTDFCFPMPCDGVELQEF